MNARAQELHAKADALEVQAELCRERGALHSQTVFETQAKHMRKQAIAAETDNA